MNRLVFFLVAATVALTMLYAKGGRNRLDIGLAMPETHVERWKKDGASLKENAEKMGYRAEVSYADADQSKQNRQIQDFITRGVKLLIVGSVSEGANEAVAEAKKEGVQVIAYDRLITNSADYQYYITFDNFLVGEYQGKSIVDRLAGRTAPQDVVLFAGAPTDNNAKYFFDGAMSRLLPAITSGQIRLIGPAPLDSTSSEFTRIATENWQANLAKARMENLLNGDASSATLAAVLAPNDTLARAIIEALRTDQKYDALDRIPVVTGQDAELASIKLIREGWQYMTVFKDTRQLAQAAIQLASAVLKKQSNPSIPGARLDETSYDTGLKIMTSYLLQPILVTKDSVQQEIIDSGFYTQEQLRN